jgi:hypothetical protein
MVVFLFDKRIGALRSARAGVSSWSRTSSIGAKATSVGRSTRFEQLKCQGTFTNVWDYDVSTETVKCKTIAFARTCAFAGKDNACTDTVSTRFFNGVSVQATASRNRLPLPQRMARAVSARR